MCYQLPACFVEAWILWRWIVISHRLAQYAHIWSTLSWYVWYYAWCKQQGTRTGKKVGFPFLSGWPSGTSRARLSSAPTAVVWLLACSPLVLFLSCHTTRQLSPNTQRPIHWHPSDAGSKIWPCHFIHNPCQHYFPSWTHVSRGDNGQLKRKY